MSDFADHAANQTALLEQSAMAHRATTTGIYALVWLCDGAFRFVFGDTQLEHVADVMSDPNFGEDTLWMRLKQTEQGWVVERDNFQCLAANAKQQLVDFLVKKFTEQLDCSMSRHPAGSKLS